MLINTADLTGAALNWAVATCEGYRNLHLHHIGTAYPMEPLLVMDHDYDWVAMGDLTYSTDWNIGGPIIERAEIDLTHQVGGGCAATLMFNKLIYEEVGPTPLIAAMRCYVAARLGSEIDVPDELRA